MIITVEEFLKGKPFSIKSIHENMIEFAKLHVTEALNKAKEVDLLEDLDYESGQSYSYVDYNAISNCYPLENIK